jgi:hypothetical protein
MSEASKACEALTIARHLLVKFLAECVCHSFLLLVIFAKESSGFEGHLSEKACQQQVKQARHARSK